jgi:hypothetical protein
MTGANVGIKKANVTYLGLIGGMTAHEDRNKVKFKLINATTVSKLNIDLRGTNNAGASAGKGYTFTVMKNANETSLSCQIIHNSISCEDTSNSVEFSAGDYFAIKVTPVNGPNGVNDNLDPVWSVATRY